MKKRKRRGNDLIRRGAHSHLVQEVKRRRFRELRREKKKRG